MNRIIYILSILFLGLSASACHDIFDEAELEDDMQIRLKSSIPVTSVMVKSEGWDYDSQIDGGLSLSFFRWDEGGQTDVKRLQPLAGVLEGTPDPSDNWSRSIHINPAQYYKDRTSDVGFIGFYPSLTNDKWVKSNTDYFTNDSQGRPTLTFNIDGQTDVLVSDFQKGNYETGINNLTLSHALCKYDIYVYAADQDTKDQWGDVEDIVLMNLPEQMFVHLPEDITDPSQPVEFSFTPAPDSPSEYTPTTISADTDLPIGLANKRYIGSYLGGSPAIGVLGVSVTAENAESSSPVSIARNFRPGYAYSIILRFSSHGVINADVVVEDWHQGADLEADVNNMFYVDLSRYGTANSYIVSSANMAYSFNATVKGNGVNVLNRYDGTTITLPDANTNLPVARVEIMSSDTKLKWDESKNDYVPPVDDDDRHAPIINLYPDIVNGLVLFDVIGAKNPDGTPKEDDYRLQRKGNVRLGGYDAMGNLVWSWHIWVTDRPLNINYGNGYTSMDRNLGAVSTDPADYNDDVPVLSGAVYQWGRKDPMFIHELKTHPDLYIKSGPVTIAEAHLHPRTFYKQGETLNNDWTTQTNDHLWGWISERDDMVKTMYDPCPPGYRVNGNPLWEYQGTNQKDPVPVYHNGLNVGYEFGIEDYTNIFYAATMFVEHNGEIISNHDPHEEDNLKAYIYRYSATPYVSDDPQKQGLAYHFRYNIDDIDKFGRTLFYEPDMGGGRVHGFPVRCVYEDSRRPVVDLSREQTSNCYAVESAGYYKFDAKAPGNSVGSLNVQFNNGTLKNITFDGGVAEELSSVTKVDVLWWQGDLTTGSSYRTFASGTPSQDEIEAECPIRILDGGALDKNGDAYFFIAMDKFKPANVVLAGYDANGVIQWTWHMWIVPEGLDVVRLGDYNVLDRNLGATYAPEAIGNVNQNNALATHGFYYQWGRKDPFVGMASYNQDANTANSSVWFYKSYNGVWTKKNTLDKFGGSRSIPQTLQSPTSFANTNNTQWQTDYGNEGGNDHPVNQLWGYTGVEGAWGDTFAKTMWDPCPVGYKVANHIVFNSGGLWNPNTGNNPIEKYWLYYNGNARSQYGVWLVSGMYTTYNGGRLGDGVKAEGVWMPYAKVISNQANYVHAGNENNIQYSSAWHSACPYSGYRSRTFTYYHTRSNINTNSYISTDHDNNTYISSATPIRCIKE